MKPLHVTLLAAGLSLAAGAPACAQMGMDFFKKPAIADLFKPVVGSGSVYETERDQKKSTIEMTVVGQESVDGKDGKDGFWLEVGHADARTGGTVYAKM